MEFTRNGEPVAPNESGEMILTDLHNYAMPFIRYAVGDMGAPSAEQCPCGRGLPLVKSIEGRVQDFIVTPEGTRIHGEFFSHLFWEMTSFAQFQIVQESQDSLVIRVVPLPSANTSQLNEEPQRIIDVVRGRTGTMKIKVEQVSKLPTTKGGKHRFVIPLGEKLE